MSEDDDELLTGGAVAAKAAAAATRRAAAAPRKRKRNASGAPIAADDAPAATGTRPQQLLENTPRPADLFALPPDQHEFAPLPGDVVGDAAAEPLPPPPPPLPAAAAAGGRWFLSGADLAGLEPADGPPPQLSRPAAATPPRAGASARPRRAVRAPARLIDSHALEAAAARDGHAMVRAFATAMPLPAPSDDAAEISSARMPSEPLPSWTLTRTHTRRQQMPCAAYAPAPPGSGAPGAQPFRVLVSPLAEAAMDFHAHLDGHEVIGLLAGAWRPRERCLVVERALPVREAAGALFPAAAGGGGNGSNGNSSGSGAGAVDVEMDAADQFKVGEVISDLWRLRVVGWYHSHPGFAPLPSAIDVANQLLAQRGAREEGGGGGGGDAGGDAGTGGGGGGQGSGGGGGGGGGGGSQQQAFEPYIAAIVSPYEPRLPAAASAVTWFAVEGGAGGGSGGGDNGGGGSGSGSSNAAVPYELAVERLARPSDGAALLRLLAPPRGPLRALAARYALKRSAADLAAPWRPAGGGGGRGAAAGGDGGNGAAAAGDGGGSGATRLDKLVASVCGWLPAGSASDAERAAAARLARRAVNDARRGAGLPAIAAATGEEGDEGEEEEEQQQPAAPPAAIDGPGGGGGGGGPAAAPLGTAAT